MNESPGKELVVRDGLVSVEFGPYQVVSLRLRQAGD